MGIAVAGEVARALARGLPVVVLESTLICHGFPRPDNIALAFETEAAVRAAGAVSAIIAVVDGRVRAGLDGDELRALAEAPDVAKCSTRDLALVAARGRSGATTIAATIFIAAQLGPATEAKPLLSTGPSGSCRDLRGRPRSWRALELGRGAAATRGERTHQGGGRRPGGGCARPSGGGWRPQPG